MTDYTLEPGVPGGQANMTPATFLSRTAQETIKAGQVVQNGSEDGTCLVAAAGSPALDPDNLIGLATNDAVAGEAVRVATHGCFWVETGGAVAPGDDVTFDSDGTGGVWGASEATKIVDAKWDSTSGGSGGLAIVRLNGFTAS